MPMQKYGISLPRINSAPLTGVEMSCSMVPRSHSRATVSEVSALRLLDMVARLAVMASGIPEAMRISRGWEAPERKPAPRPAAPAAEFQATDDDVPF